MNAIIAGPVADELGSHLEDQGVETTRIDGIATRPALETAGILDADLFVLTDPGQATAIPIARDLNEAVSVVVYSDESVPDFARAQADLIIDPAVLDPGVVAEELARS